MSKPSALTKLPMQDPATGTLIAVVETPKGARNKYDYDPDLCCLKLAAVLPEGMVFPFDFGFIPSTQAEDGDPLDVAILLDQPVPPGCVVEVRIIGAILAEQSLFLGSRLATILGELLRARAISFDFSECHSAKLSFT